LLVIHQPHIEKIKEHASAAYPEECVGGLIGSSPSDNSSHVSEILPLENVATASKEFRYSVDPKEMLGCEKRAEEQGLELIGFYHSHPNAPPIPSLVDLEGASPWYVYLIMSVIKGKPGGFRAWKLDEKREKFIPLEINNS
jgi:proteasome lid subunit RPN8/RPN11